MSKGEGHGILVVDDEVDALSNLRDILEMSGFVVHTAACGAEALAFNQWQSLAAIVLDRRLPDTSGDDLVSDFQALAPGVGIVMATAYAEVDSVITALQRGAFDYLIKPINPDLLLASLDRYLTLKEAQERHRQSEQLALLGQAMACVGHESGTALHNIGTGIRLLRKYGHMEARRTSILTEIEKAAYELRRLYGDIRSYAAPLIIKCEACSLPEIWREAWSEARTRYKDREATLREEGDTGEDSIWTDRLRLKKVFYNLFANSFAACPGPLHVTVRRWAELSGDRKHARIAVCDNGPGLTSEQCKRICEPFVTTKQHGTGLGLAIVRRIMGALDGEITVGTPERGAEFVLSLPVGGSQ